MHGAWQAAGSWASRAGPLLRQRSPGRYKRSYRQPQILKTMGDAQNRILLEWQINCILVVLKAPAVTSLRDPLLYSALMETLWPVAPLRTTEATETVGQPELWFYQWEHPACGKFKPSFCRLRSLKSLHNQRSLYPRTESPEHQNPQFQNLRLSIL